MHWRADGAGEEGEEPQRCLTEMEDLLGTHYCDPAKMSTDAKFNDVNKNKLHFCVQGTFKADGYERGPIDIRWQSLEQLTERCSREDFERLHKQYLKDLEKTFKRDAKRFKTAAQLEEE